MPKAATIASVSADRRSSDVLQLIVDYQRAARAAVVGLRRQTGVANLLQAWKAGKLRRAGQLRQPRGRYSFHGTGCRFQISGRTVDVDFGPSGRHDGFDAWRLGQYARSAFEWLDVSGTVISRSLRDLESSGLIVRPELNPSPHLYYFADDLGNGQSASKRRTH
ncbi:MAG: hypothetical protein ABSH08_08720 [Tepidisphaeraceae bacterium]